MRSTHSKAEYTFKLTVTHEGITHSKTVLKRTLKIDNANETFVILCKTIQAAGFDQSGFQPPLPPQGDLVVALVGYGRDGSQLAGMWNRVGVTQAKAAEQPRSPFINPYHQKQMEAFLQTQLELAQVMLKDNRLSDSQRINWMGYKDAIQKVRLFQADQPAPATPKVRILLDDDGYAAATTSIEMDVVFLDNNCLPEDKPKKRVSNAFYAEYNHLPHQYRP